MCPGQRRSCYRMYRRCLDGAQLQTKSMPNKLMTIYFADIADAAASCHNLSIYALCVFLRERARASICVCPMQHLRHV